MSNRFIDPEDVKKLYNDMDEIWPSEDKWYQYTYFKIQKYLKHWESILELNNTTLILNAGSGGNTYNIKGNHTHIDISEKHLSSIENAIIASVEDIPLNDNYFDICICVGSVINYCDVVSSISEFNRILKNGGYLILDFDQSRNYEFLGSDTYNSNLDMIETFNSGYVDKIWVYSEKYISSTLKHFNFTILDKEYYHTLSSLVYKFTKDEQKAAKFVNFDKITKWLPLIRKISNNIILIAPKI
jgi:ubiquinone/menaquinone biosynthesis C-methylase UbiE